MAVKRKYSIDPTSPEGALASRAIQRRVNAPVSQAAVPQVGDIVGQYMSDRERDQLAAKRIGGQTEATERRLGLSEDRLDLSRKSLDFGIKKNRENLATQRESFDEARDMAPFLTAVGGVGAAADVVGGYTDYRTGQRNIQHMTAMEALQAGTHAQSMETQNKLAEFFSKNAKLFEPKKKKPVPYRDDLEFKQI